MNPVYRILPIILLIQGCAYFRSSTEQPNWQAFDQQQVQNDIQPLELEEPYAPSEAIRKYFDYYDLNPCNARHLFGTVVSENEKLAVHVFMPEKPRGSLFLLHGYFDHTGTLSPLIKEGIRQGYAIVAWDLPGHGLSSGTRTDTGQFELCAQQFTDIVGRASARLPQPFFLIAHSTGASIGLEYMYNNDDCEFGKIIFLAPLIRHKNWRWGKFGYAIAKPFTNQIRRREKKNSSDETYLNFVKNDPLHSSVLSFEYLQDLYDWEKTTTCYPVWTGPVCIIQGNKDNIIDWKYNLEFFHEKIAEPEIHIIPGARHQLINEKKSIRKTVFKIIFNYLNDQAEAKPRQ